MYSIWVGKSEKIVSYKQVITALRFKFSLSYLPTPPLGQDMTQGQFLSGV